MRHKGHFANAALRSLAGTLIFLGTMASLRADQVEMQNGDRYVGKVLSLNANTLVVQNEVLGVVRIPRDKVATITLVPGSVAIQTSGGPLPPVINGRPPVPTNAAPEIASPFRDLAAHTNLIKKIQSQFLSDAGPEANKKFEEMLNGLMTGKLNMDDLRAQAQTAADQIRAAKREGGEDPGFAADTYLAILDQFLKATPASSGVKTNAPSAGTRPKAGGAEDDNN